MVVGRGKVEWRGFYANARFLQGKYVIFVAVRTVMHVKLGEGMTHLTARPPQGSISRAYDSPVHMKPAKSPEGWPSETFDISMSF